MHINPAGRGGLMEGRKSETAYVRVCTIQRKVVNILGHFSIQCSCVFCSVLEIE